MGLTIRHDSFEVWCSEHPRTLTIRDFHPDSEVPCDHAWAWWYRKESLERELRWEWEHILKWRLEKAMRERKQEREVEIDFDSARAFCPACGEQKITRTRGQLCSHVAGLISLREDNPGLDMRVTIAPGVPAEVR